jgi:hypothetical protein
MQNETDERANLLDSTKIIGEEGTFEENSSPANGFVFTPFTISKSQISLEKEDGLSYFLKFEVSYRSPFKILIWYNVIVREHEQRQITTELTH